MKENQIRLPGKHEMLARLHQKPTYPPFTEEFTDILLKSAWGRFDVPNFVVMLSSAIKEYTADKPEPILIGMQIQVPYLIRALVDDEKFVEGAKLFHLRGFNVLYEEAENVFDHSKYMPSVR